jgi:hypothetical protein
MLHCHCRCGCTRTEGRRAAICYLSLSLGCVFFKGWQKNPGRGKRGGAKLIELKSGPRKSDFEFRTLVLAYMATRPTSAGVPQNGRVLGAGCWGYTQASTATATLLRPAPRLLSCWSDSAAGLHPSMPACQQLGVLACWGACQQHRHASSFRPLPRWLAIDQHASMPTCQQLGMLACWHAGVHPSSTDRPAFLPPSLAGWPSTSMPACQHANNWGCWHAGVHPSILAPLPRWLATDQHASMPACQLAC